MGYHGMFSTSYMYVLNELRVCSERATCILNELHVCPEPNCVFFFCRFVLTFCAYCFVAIMVASVATGVAMATQRDGIKTIRYLFLFQQFVEISWGSC